MFRRVLLSALVALLPLPARADSEPAEVAQADGQQLDLVPPPTEDIAHLMHVAHHRRDVLRAPLVAAGVVQDRNSHQATSARSERPLIRRQAMSATVRMRSS